MNIFLAFENLNAEMLTIEVTLSYLGFGFSSVSLMYESTTCILEISETLSLVAASLLVTTVHQYSWSLQ